MSPITAPITIVIPQTPRPSASATARKTPRRPRRRARRKTTPEPLGVRITQRDFAIVKAVYEYRALTTTQINALLFRPPATRALSPLVDYDPHKTRCQLRLKLLIDGAYLRRQEQLQRLSDGRKPFVYSLEVKGAQLLESEEGIEVDWSEGQADVSWLFLKHMLLTNDIRIALTVGSEALGAIITQWQDEKSLKSSHQSSCCPTGSTGVKRQPPPVPDGYFILTYENKRMHHFLEIDRGTETVSYTKDGKRDWSRKIKSYLEYYNSGAYQARYGTKGMRVFTVTTGKKRMQHLKEATETAGGKSRFWFTTFDQVTSSSILTDPIWSVASQAGQHSLIAHP